MLHIDRSSIEQVRRQFPALDRVHDTERVAYFDGPGGTQVPRSVVEAMADYLFHHNANTHWEYPSSAETDAAIEQARATLAAFLNGRADEIVFGQNMTTLTFHLARAIGWTLSAGDAIVVTELDHHANVAPWRALERERGVRIRSVRMDPRTGTLDWRDLEESLADRPRLLAIGAASNALGTINDVQRAARLAHEAGALAFVDAVHWAPHTLVDVQAIGCDFLACSPYKFYGPHLGVLWGRRDLLERFEAPKLRPAPDTAPEKWETGTLSHEAIVGAAAAVEFIASLPHLRASAASTAELRSALAAAMEWIHTRGQVLFTRMWEGLNRIPSVRTFGVPPGAPRTPRTPTAAFTVAGVPSSEVARALASRGVFVSHGDFYAATVVERLALGEEGLVRAGCACYTSEDEVERLLAGVAEIAASPKAAGGVRA